MEGIDFLSLLGEKGVIFEVWFFLDIPNPFLI
jgi:hypothetical protein